MNNRIFISIAALSLGAGTLSAAEATSKPAEPVKAVTQPAPVPYPLLNPPPGMTPAISRGRAPWSYPGPHNPDPNAPGRQPRQTWTPEERKVYEARVEWFHQAKFGLFFHYINKIENTPRVGKSSWQKWDDAKWDAWVEAVDVEKVADQAKELGAGYVVITLGQSEPYFCSPNPVMEQLWQLKPGQYTSRRDLPMDLFKALEKRGIPMMLYIKASDAERLPSPPSFKKGDRADNWIKAFQWYSDHYGKACKGWWVDGGEQDYTKDWRNRLLKALKHGNPDALVGHGGFETSDYLHGHCIVENWKKQQKVLPYFGRWDPDFKIQYHVLLTVGSNWGFPDTPKRTEELARYAANVVKGGGVITFDVGTFQNVDGKPVVAPFLKIPPAQFKQLEAVRDALKNIPASDGSGK